MKNSKVLAALWALLLFTAVTPLVKAQDTGTQYGTNLNAGMSQTVTFNSKAELPGMTLDKGSYQLKLIGGGQSDHQVIQVFNSDGSKFQGNILAIPDSRITATSGQDLVMYPQGTSRDVQAVKAWIPSSGQPLVLVWSKSEATKLAKNNNLTVPFTDASGLSDRDKTDQVMQASISAISPNGTETSWTPSSSALDQSSSGGAVASNERREFNQSNTSNLPRTASSLPLIGLIGLLSIGAALVLKLALRS